MGVRKDATARNTVKKVKEILKKVGISTIEKDKICHDNFWYSIRVELQELEGVGVNGKGITEEYALASAYGELMERLQSETLVDNLFSAFPHDKEFFSSIDELKEALGKIAYNDILDRVQVNNKKIFEKKKFKDWLADAEVYLPQWFIDMDCMTTGLCAGNTFYEAVSQGIFEIFERNARKKIYDNTLQVKCIDKESLRKLKSWKLLDELEKMGFDWEIIDCTEHGIFPVLGFLLWDNKHENYLFDLGSDINLDICIERCVTEMFQGRKVNFLFYKNMENIYDLYQYKELNNNIEYQKSVLSNKGKAPYSLLFCEKGGEDWNNAFYNESLSNKKVFEKLVAIISKLGKKIYIRDMSFLGFPTYRVFITDISPVINATHYYLEFDDYINHFINNICSIDKCNDKDIIKLINDFSIVEKAPFNNFISIIKRTKGIILDKSEEMLLDNNYVKYLLNKKSGDQEKTYIDLRILAKKYYELRKYIFLMYIDDSSHISSSEKKAIKSLFDDDTIFNSLSYINCPHCEECRFNTRCKINEWKIIYEKLSAIKRKYFTEGKT